MSKKRITNEEFVKKFKDLKKNDILLLSEYKSSNIKIKCKCLKCGYEWESVPSVLLREKSGCPKCSGVAKKTTEEFKSEVFNMFGEEYTVLGEYVNSSTKILIRHNSCMNEFYIKPSTFLYEHQCPNHRYEKIAKKTRKSNEEFKEEVVNLVGDEYDVLDKYINDKTKIEFIHNTCGTKFMMSPNKFLVGNRCPNKNCVSSRMSKMLIKPKEVFKKEFEIASNGEYELLSDYIKNSEKIKIKHIKCGNIFEVTASNMLVKRSHCPNCINVSNGENLISDILNSNNINFIEQKKFDKLYGINGGHLSYDFYLPDYNLLIEYQGKQHEVPVEHFGGEEQLVVQKEHDERKRDYAKNNGFELLEIWYYDFDKINDILFEKLNLLK